MLRVIALCSLLIIPTLVSAQTPDSKRWEVFAGYSFERVDYEKLRDVLVFDGVQAPINGFAEDDFRRTFKTANNLNGFAASATYYWKKNIGITGEFSFNTGSQNKDVSQVNSVPGDTVNVRRTKYNILAGPQFKYKSSSRFEPFARILAGVTYQKNRSRFLLNGAEIDRLEDNFKAFTLSIGGGIDLRISKNVALRLVQIDYTPAFTRERNIFLDSSFPGDETVFAGRRRDGFRIAVGIVFR
jgi:opacity protein-like surface antigen